MEFAGNGSGHNAVSFLAAKCPFSRFPMFADVSGKRISALRQLVFFLRLLYHKLTALNNGVTML